MSRQKIATNKVKKIIRFRKTNKNSKRIIPSIYSKNKFERSLGLKLMSLKHAKRYPGKNGCIFYDNLENLAAEQNDPSLFEYVNKKNVAIKNLQSVLNFISENSRFPNTIEDNEKKLNKILCNFKQIKNRSIPGIWYLELDEMMSNAGYPDFFKSPKENEMVKCDVDDLLLFYKKNKKKPSQLSDDIVERRLYRKLILLKQIKNKKSVMVWNPEIDEKIKKMKIKNIFN